MNVLGHTFVAQANGASDPEFVLGAVLPDLASMAGVRLARADLPEVVGRGVRCHLRSDEAFHGHPAFRRGQQAIRVDLAERGLPSGPARAVAHAGWELLLDGTLVGSPTEAAFRAALAVGARATAAMSERDGRRWLGFLGRRPGAGGLRYDDPRWVADRLHAMLATRRRLSFAADRVPEVAAVLGQHVDQVASVAPAVLADVARTA
jgi:hypothetical protein